MKKRCIMWLLSFGLVFTLSYCGSPDTEKSESMRMDGKTFNKGTFGYDAAFLQAYAGAVLLKDENDKAMVVVSPRLQGKVFTSSASGLDGPGYGWINYDLIRSGEILEHMNGYGGEDRLWLGPEGGQFSIFFKPGTEMTIDNWFTPPPIDTEPFDLIEASDTSVLMRKNMSLSNYAGTNFLLRVERHISLLSNARIRSNLAINPSASLQMVGFSSENTLINLGDSPLTEESGTVCIWILGMFRPSPNGLVVVPYREGEETDLGPPATTDYFGEIPADRIRISDGTILFKADGKQRGKIGVSALRAKNIAGSYDPDQQVLTVIQYNLPETPAKYVNQIWKIQEKPFAGDVVNSYNDGPLADGSQMGPFYELESCSPAAFLDPGEDLVHIHSTYHFTGDKTELDAISRQVLGIGLQDMVIK